MANTLDPDEDAQRRADVFEHLCAVLPTLDPSVKTNAWTVFNSLGERASPDDLNVRARVSLSLPAVWMDNNGLQCTTARGAAVGGMLTVHGAGGGWAWQAGVVAGGTRGPVGRRRHEVRLEPPAVQVRCSFPILLLRAA